MDFFASFLDSVPGWIRLLLAVAITVGVTLTCVVVFHTRILEMNDDDEENDNDSKDRKDDAAGEVGGQSAANVDPEVLGTASTQDSDEDEDEGDSELPKPPASHVLAGRVISLVGVAFVFLFAFCVNNFWTNNHDARTAVESELADLTRISALAQGVGGPAQQQIEDALSEYRRSITVQEWPLMRAADTNAASRQHEKAALGVALAVQKAGNAGAEKSMEWSGITKAVDDMLNQGRTRATSLPPPAAPGVVSLIFILGITNLGLTTAYQPARLSQNLFLMATMAAITALMFFIVVEASNPYVGDGGIPSSLFSP